MGFLGEWICGFTFDKHSKSYEICIEVINEVAEKGYLYRIGRGVRRHVVRRLEKLGVLKEERLYCENSRHLKRVMVLNTTLLQRLYEELRRLKTPPMRIPEC